MILILLFPFFYFQESTYSFAFSCQLEYLSTSVIRQSIPIHLHRMVVSISPHSLKMLLNITSELHLVQISFCSIHFSFFWSFNIKSIQFMPKSSIIKICAIIFPPSANEPPKVNYLKLNFYQIPKIRVFH